jgi:hypothetical protein
MATKHNGSQEQRLHDLKAQLEHLLKAIELERARSGKSKLPSDPATRMALIQHQARALRWLATRPEARDLVQQALEATRRSH